MHFESPSKLTIQFRIEKKTKYYTLKEKSILLMEEVFHHGVLEVILALQIQMIEAHYGADG